MIVMKDAKTSMQFGIISSGGSSNPTPVPPMIYAGLISYSNVTFVLSSYFTQSMDAPVAISIE